MYENISPFFIAVAIVYSLLTGLQNNKIKAKKKILSIFLFGQYYKILLAFMKKIFQLK